ncbi:Very-long-chain aldehyde decarbonylase CER1 [Citrus sinensis]|uniref:Very-long-chain aldehyde decarbonylase CER1 n=1 Tax=Citrus sinensis TaxID=2711 RepID=A0ACB8JT87_CITSI|nr:Very-long-chain aldehyde decarbonylase CER1 [Citrus sinensis]
MLPGGTQFPIWRLDGVILMALLHAGPVEFVYYWLHRALHHHYLYSRSHHHSSIVPEPITSVTRPFAEHITYFVLFATPLITTALTGAGSIVPAFGYITYIDLMNNMGHCNFGLIPKWLFTIFPPLKYLMYTPSNRLNKLKLQTWAKSKYNMQYFSQQPNESINRLIEEAILEAEEKGARVISLGLLNQGEELNRYGGLFVHKNPELKIKVAYATAFALCQKGIQVVTLREDEHEKLIRSFGSNLKIWLVGNGLTEEEQSKAERGTMFVPFSQFPPATKRRKDCTYHLTLAMATPAALENVDSCENWLPRRVMSAWRIGGIVHALEGWNEHECGYTISNVDTVWDAALRHGFLPLTIPTQS